jgi:hypothetical protein
VVLIKLKFLTFEFPPGIPPAELVVLYYSEGQGKEIRLRKFVSAAAHCTV